MQYARFSMPVSVAALSGAMPAPRRIAAAASAAAVSTQASQVHVGQSLPCALELMAKQPHGVVAGARHASWGGARHASWGGRACRVVLIALAAAPDGTAGHIGDVSWERGHLLGTVGLDRPCFYVSGGFICRGIFAVVFAVVLEASFLELPWVGAALACLQPRRGSVAGKAWGSMRRGCAAVISGGCSVAQLILTRVERTRSGP